MKDCNVLLINDICSYGKASLTVNIPVLSAFGIKVSPLITVLLSNHTAFESFCAFDLTSQLEQIVNELKKRNAKFDALYIGWLASDEQVDIVIDIIEYFKIKIVLLDPILGDNGKLYSSMTEKHIKSLKRILKYATIITPNITELCLLLDKNPTKKYTEDNVIEMAKELSNMVSENVIVTSVEKDNKFGSLAYNKKNNDITASYFDKINVAMPGTGDAFASALLGYILNDYSIEDSLKKATQFIYTAIELSVKENDNRIYGISIEKRLNLLKDLF